MTGGDRIKGRLRDTLLNETMFRSPMPSPPLLGEPPAEIEISVGVAALRIRGVVDAKTLAAVLKALRVIA